MGATRQRFTPAERTSFGAVPIGGAVEWRNGAHWWPGVKTEEIGMDSIGMQRFMLRNLADTRTIGKGQTVGGYPKHVRVPAEGTEVGSGAGKPRYRVHGGRWVVV